MTDVIDLETGEVLSKSHALIRSRDVSALEVPTEVTVPATLDNAVTVLDSVGGLLTAGAWGTAAIVYAYTRDEVIGGDKRSADFMGKSAHGLSAREFAEKGIRGLKSHHSVLKYRERWQNAMELGFPEAKPGVTVPLPDEDITPPHIAGNSGNNEWYTPPRYIEAARIVMGGIDLDPASSETANEIVGAAQIYTQEDNGLEQEWSGRVWMNPPYAQPLVDHFAQKLANEYSRRSVIEACVLVNNATETAWFQTLMGQASAACFPVGRVKFWHPEKESAPLQGQAVIYLGAHPDIFIRAFAGFGAVVRQSNG